MKSKKVTSSLTCPITRRKEAITALLSLAWKKSRKDRPTWILQELKHISPR